MDEELPLMINLSEVSSLILILTEAHPRYLNALINAKAELHKPEKQRDMKFSDEEIHQDIGVTEIVIQDIQEVLVELRQLFQELEIRKEPNTIIKASWMKDA